MSERGSHQQRRPPDVEEALSSMLWTPYDRTPTDSSSEDDDEQLNNRIRFTQINHDDCHTMCSSYLNNNTNNNNNNDLLPHSTLSISSTRVAAMATKTVDGVAQHPTLLVPFASLFYKNNNLNDNNDDDDDDDSYTAPTINHLNSYGSTSHNVRFSYPYCGLWSPTSAQLQKQPPSYESLYATASSEHNFKSAQSVRGEVLNETSSTAAGSSEKSLDLETGISKDSISHSVFDDQNFQVNSISGSSSVGLPRSFGHHVVASVNDSIRNNRTEQPITTRRLSMAHQQHAKEESQQSRESNNNNDHATINSCNQQLVLQLHAKADAARQDLYECIATQDGEIQSTTGVTVTTTASREQVNQPVSSISQCFVSPVNVPRVNANANAAMESATTTTHGLDQRMNSAAAMNTIANLFTLVRDKATLAIATRDGCSDNSGSGGNKSHKATTHYSSANELGAHSSKCEELTIIQSCTNSFDSRATVRAASSIPVQPELPSLSSSSSYLHSRLLLWRKGRVKESRTRVESLPESPVVPVALPQQQRRSSQFANSSANSISVLTPNKCFAELERLYAEFQASESALAAVSSDSSGDGRSQHGDEPVGNMRVNVPAADINSNAAIVSLRSEKPSKRTAPAAPNKIVLTCDRSDINTICGNIAGSATIPINDNLNNNNNNYNNNNNNHYKKISDDASDIRHNGEEDRNKSDSNGNSLATLATDPRQYQSSVTIKVNDSNNIALSKCNVVLQHPVVNKNGVSVINCNYLSTCDPENNNTPKRVDDKNHNRESVSDPIVKNTSDIVPNVLLESNSEAVENNKSYGDAKGNDGRMSTATGIADSSVNIICVSVESQNVGICELPLVTECQNRLQIDEATPRTEESPEGGIPRTFISTECQTDDITSESWHRENDISPTLSNREVRRRERRERRHQQLQSQPSINSLQLHCPRRRPPERHSMPIPLPLTHLYSQHMHHIVPPSTTIPATSAAILRPMLPDLVHTHFPPPYSTMPLANGGCPNGPILPHTPHPVNSPPPIPPRSGATLVTSVISTGPLPNVPPVVSDGRFTLPLPIMRRTPSERSGKGCCGQWFAGPPLRALIAVVALGGVACALGGAALGATALAGPPSSHFTAALLMIGVGVILVTVSGAAWRMTAPGGRPCLGLGSAVDLGRCTRRPCGRNNGTPHGLLYPEFQHRPPPPSYQASMQEYRLRLLLLDRDRQNAARGTSPPPTYRSHVGSLLRAPLTATLRAGASSIGRASEFSLPPSYRSRNISSAATSSERSIETAPSGRLLANEDIPEPATIEQLLSYNTLQSRHSRMQQIPTESLETATQSLRDSSQTRNVCAAGTTNHAANVQSSSEEKVNVRESTPTTENTVCTVIHNIITNPNTNSELITIVNVGSSSETHIQRSDSKISVDQIEFQEKL